MAQLSATRIGELLTAIGTAWTLPITWAERNLAARFGLVEVRPI